MEVFRLRRTRWQLVRELWARRRRRNGWGSRGRQRPRLSAGRSRRAPWPSTTVSWLAPRPMVSGSKAGVVRAGIVWFPPQLARGRSRAPMRRTTWVQRVDLAAGQVEQLGWPDVAEWCAACSWALFICSWFLKYDVTLSWLGATVGRVSHVISIAGLQDTKPKYTNSWHCGAGRLLGVAWHLWLLVVYARQ